LKLLLQFFLITLCISLYGCDNREATPVNENPTVVVTPLPIAASQAEIGATSTVAADDTPESAQSSPPTVVDTVVDDSDLPPTYYSYKVITTFPHDPTAFTQGLFFDQGQLYEGTGLYGKSTLRRVDLTSGTVEEQIALPEEYFGEGIAIADGKIYQLTWQEQIGFIYARDTFERLGEFTYTTQGWGLTFDGQALIMSDGTDRLFFLDPATMTVVKQIAVSLFDPSDQSRKAVERLNELEYIEGELFANIWQTDAIVRIDPATGNVTGVIDLSGLLPAEDYSTTTDVLNGIAYLPEGKRLFVTGKNWPTLFEIQLVQQ